MAKDLKKEKCEPCSSGTEPIKGEELRELMGDINKNWNLVNEKKIERKFEFNNFQEALDFVNEVGAIAEEQGHHPDIAFGWGRAKISFMTHKIDGLSRNDFIMASIVDEIE